MKKLIIIIALFAGITSFAQEKLTTDELFIKAKNAAFEKKDRILARRYCRQALEKSPDYSDISIFLARLYTWDSKYDSARVIFNDVLKRDPSNEDAYSGAIDLEYWTDNYNAALGLSNQGVSKFPNSADLLLKKARVLKAMEKYDEAFSTVELSLAKNRSNEDALIFAERLKEDVRKNAISLTYQYDHFSKTFDPWHLGSISYSRKTPLGTTILRANFARRFETNGVQYEVDMYPKFADGFYSYLNFGYSEDPIFPKYRYGASLYLSLPWSMEIDGGFRLLKFSSDTWIYTFALGKYWGNYWFSLRTFITPQIEKSSYSFSLIIRYYLSGADDYLSLSVGTGITPSEGIVDLQGNWLKSNKVGLEYQNKIGKAVIMSISADYSNEEFIPGNIRDRFSAGMGIKFLF